MADDALPSGLVQLPDAAVPMGSIYSNMADTKRPHNRGILRTASTF